MRQNLMVVPGVRILLSKLPSTKEPRMAMAFERWIQTDTLWYRNDSLYYYYSIIIIIMTIVITIIIIIIIQLDLHGNVSARNNKLSSYDDSDFQGTVRVAPRVSDIYSLALSYRTFNSASFVIFESL